MPRAPWFLEEGFRILLLYICLNFLLRWTGLTNAFLCSCSQMLGPFWQRETEYIKGSAGGMLILFPLLEEHSGLEGKTDKNGNYLSPLYLPDVEAVWWSEGKSADTPQNSFLNDEKISQLSCLVNIILGKSHRKGMQKPWWAPEHPVCPGLVERVSLTCYCHERF